MTYTEFVDVVRSVVSDVPCINNQFKMHPEDLSCTVSMVTDVVGATVSVLAEKGYFGGKWALV